MSKAIVEGAVVALGLMAVAACVSNGSATSGGASAQAAAAGPVVPAAAVKDAHLSGEDIVALQKSGYRIVDRNGEKLYCSTDPKTGSRIVHDNTCLTEKEMMALREETKRSMQNMARELPPPQGN